VARDRRHIQAILEQIANNKDVVHNRPMPLRKLLLGVTLRIQCYEVVATKVEEGENSVETGAPNEHSTCNKTIAKMFTSASSHILSWQKQQLCLKPTAAQNPEMEGITWFLSCGASFKPHSR
jgi:transcription-repair coupling factor (superfamily II helicase)